MINKAVPENLITFIRKHKKFLLLSHISPDGDCLASSLALGKCLQRMGKQVAFCNPGPFGNKELRHLEEQFTLHLPENLDERAVIMLDCSMPDRIAQFAENIDSLPIAVIDHHSSGGTYGTIQFINHTAPSTTLLVQQIIAALGMTLQKEEAELIFYGFATDTDFFHFLEEDNRQTFYLLAELAEAGVSPRKIYDMIRVKQSLTSRKLLGKLLERAETYYDGRFIFTWSSFEELKNVDRNDRDSSELYQQLMNVHTVEILLVMWEDMPERISVNIRTSGSIDAGKLAALYGGGGHVRAAGFTMNTTMQKLFESIQKNIAKFF